MGAPGRKGLIAPGGQIRKCATGGDAIANCPIWTPCHDCAVIGLATFPKTGGEGAVIRLAAPSTSHADRAICPKWTLT
jgi:hypothetical protein